MKLVKKACVSFIAEEQASTSDVTPAKAVKKEVELEAVPQKTESALERKERRRREAEARKQLGKKRGPLEKKISTLEKSIAEFEEQETALVAKFGEDLSGKEIQDINIKLDAIATKKEKCETEWEGLSMELEELLEKFGGDSVS